MVIFAVKPVIEIADCVSASDGAGPRKVLADATAGSFVSSLFCVHDMQIKIATDVAKIGTGGESLSLCGVNGFDKVCDLCLFFCMLVYWCTSITLIKAVAGML